jgi:iron complex transport system ATP-binding protein
MPVVEDNILTIKLLEIGYASGRRRNALLHPIKARANKGEIIAVIGRNGAGKSTLLRTIAGLQPPLAGEIYFKERRITEYSRKEFARHVGYVSTEPVEVANMTVWDLVALGRFPHTSWTGRIDDDDSIMILNALSLTAMASERNKYLSELSDGERQKVMIARVLAQDAGLMILDEPSAFLDAGSRYEILNILHRLSSDQGKTIIYSTHDLQMALSQSDKIWLINDDNLKEGAPEDLMLDGSLNEIFESPAVHFNPEDGTFSVKRKRKGFIYIEGEGKIRYWTIKALMRAGYSVTDKKEYPYIKLPGERDAGWYLYSDIEPVIFGSLYELVNHLSNKAMETV